LICFVEPVARVWDIIAPGLRWWGWTSTHSEPLPSRTPLAVEIRLCTSDRWIDDLHIRREVGEPEIIVEVGRL